MNDSATGLAPTAQESGDWRLEIPEDRRRLLRAWFWSGALLTFVILVVGGITRLTQSGLSIVDWAPIMGVIPPLSEAQWQEAFDRYRQFPEYQQLRQGMTLSEFQFIFFWEYFHRMIARFIGIVFLVPFVFFWIRGYFNRPLLKRALALFALGALQGLVGWLMVASGLVDRPHVSHFRLAIHLSIAFAIFGCCVWYAADLKVSSVRERVPAVARRSMLGGLYLVGGLLAVQIFWGALVAGLKAGLFFNTFPLMAGGWLPPQGMDLQPALLNLVENPITVQWMHRLLGTVLGVVAIGFYLRVRSGVVDAASRRMNAALLGLILFQYLLGVLTLIYRVPVTLGVAHQAAAMVIFGVWLLWLHRVHNLQPAVAPPRHVAQPA
jgi:heme a synthase